MSKEIRIMGVPMDLGQGRRGVDMGPSALRYAELDRRLEGLGYVVKDAGNIPVPVPEEIPDTTHDGLRHLAVVANVNRALAAWCAKALAEGAIPLVLGGRSFDCGRNSSGGARGGAHWRTLGRCSRRL